MTLRENLGTLRSGLGVEFQCPHCNSTEIIKVVKVIGKQCYRCKNCQKRFITDYTYKAYLPSINNSPKKDWAFAVRHEICQHSLFYGLSITKKKRLNIKAGITKDSLWKRPLNMHRNRFSLIDEDLFTLNPYI